VQAENLVAGFACGLMDQIVSSVGRKNELLGIDCNTNEIEARIPLPKDLRLWAVDSGAFHGKEGEQYSTIRAAAFMGMRYLEEATKVPPFVPCLRVNAC
jgi:galactokinase